MINDFINAPVLITGVERSGSSIIARILGLCGVWLGQTNGMYENNKINKLVDYYYNFSFDKRGQFPMPNVSQLVIPINWKSNIENVLNGEKFEGKSCWAYKNSRVGQTWPIWNNAYPNAKWIIVRRRTGDIISSCLKTGYMSAFADKQNQQLVGVTNEQDGWLWWVHEHEKRFVEMMEAGLNCKVIWPERMVSGDYQQIYEMLLWLGLDWDDRLVDMVQGLLIRKKERV